MKKILCISLVVLLAAVSLGARDRFDHRALLWWTPNKEIVLAIDYYSRRVDILMEIDWKKIKGNRLVLNHDLIFLVGVRQVRIPLKTYIRKRHRGIFKIGTIRNEKKEEILLQNGINYIREGTPVRKNTSPYKDFGVPGF